MKRINLKSFAITILMAITFTTNAQALVVKGHVKNSDNKSSTAFYTLSNSYETLEFGTCSKLKLKLGFNDCYFLTFSKKGFRSKTITISTFSSDSSRYRISFDVVLIPCSENDAQEFDQIAGRIYYDKRHNDYNFKTCEIPRLIELKKEPVSDNTINSVSKESSLIY
jgi:hypothetical protein